MKYLPRNKEFLFILFVLLVLVAFCCCLKAHCGSSRRFVRSLYQYDSDNEFEITVNDNEVPH